MLHGALDCFYKLIERHNILVEEIERITAYCHPTVAEPCFTNQEVINLVDAQFNPRYVFAVAAHRVKIGVEWQDEDMMKNPKILEFGKKISCIPHPEFGKKGPGGFPLFISKVEIVARGKTYSKESTRQRGSARGTELRDEELIEKFRHNAARVLTQNKINNAIQAFLNLENLTSIEELMEHISM